MPTPRVDRKRPATSNGTIEDLKSSKLDTSDSATPETGDEADDGTASFKLGVEDEAPRAWEDDEGSHSVNLNDPAKPILGSASIPLNASVSSQEIIFGQTAKDEVRLKPLTDQQDEVGSRLPPNSVPPRPPRLSGRRTHRVSAEDRPSEIIEEEEEEDDSGSEYSEEPPETLIWNLRMKCGKVVNNEYVQITIICLIILNALMMGIATFDFVTENPQADKAFSAVDRGFLVVFSIEVTMQLFYLGLTLLVDGWLVFDLVIVILSWSFESLQIVRAFRIFRAFRLITRVKPLRDLVLAIGAVLPRMYAIAALLLLIFYIFSVLFTELFSGLPLSDNYFSSLDASLFTCMEMMTLEWGEIAREVMLYEPWAWAPLLAFIMITGFIVFNLIVAVVCDAVAVTEKTVRELDGFESDNPVHKLAEAQERIDLLHCHIDDMLRTQTQVQEMIEMMAGELLHLEAERMKAENREAELRIEMDRRIGYQKSMESKSQIQSLERNYILEKERREAEKKLREIKRKALLEAEANELPASPDLKRSAKKGSSNSLRSMFVRDLSFKSGSSRGPSRTSKEGSNSKFSESAAFSRDESRKSALSREGSRSSFNSDVEDR